MTIDLGGRLATVVVLTALEVERHAMVRNLIDLREDQHPTGTLFEVGRLHDTPWRVVVVTVGAGNLSAAALAERAIAAYRPEVLLFVGVAGGLHDDIELGDIIVATKIYAYHGGKEESGEFLARPRAWNAPHHLEQLARSVARTIAWEPSCHSPTDRSPVVHFRPIAGGEVVLDSRTVNVAHRLRQHYNDAAAIEMESAGVAEAGHLNNDLPVLIIRGISDRADGGKEQADRGRWQHQAAHNASVFTRWLIVRIGSQPSAPYVGNLSAGTGSGRSTNTSQQTARPIRRAPLPPGAPVPAPPSEPTRYRYRVAAFAVLMGLLAMFLLVRDLPTRAGSPADGVGVPTGTHLSIHDGRLALSTAGAVIENLLVLGPVTVSAPGVTLRRVRVAPHRLRPGRFGSSHPGPDYGLRTVRWSAFTELATVSGRRRPG